MKNLKEYLIEGIFDIEDNIEKSDQYVLIGNILNDIKSNPKNNGFYTVNDKNKKDILNVCHQLGFKKAKTWKDMIDENYIVVRHSKYSKDIVEEVFVYKSHNDCGYINFNKGYILHPYRTRLRVENVVYKTPAIFKKLYDVFIVSDEVADMFINIYK